ncbi:MAG: energy transducer TonB [Flavobacteriaceae bacterium]|nr:energy transducer TonB [Flavobacteriaceae bacterium]
MAYFDTIHKKKSATLTAIIALLILFLIFNFGMKYLDPPEEFGIAVNFGTTDFGSGDVQPTEALKPAEQEPETELIEELEDVEEEIVQEQPEEISKPITQATENVITQNNEEAIAIKKQKEAKRREDLRKKNEADKKAAIEREKATKKRKKIEAEKRKAKKERQEKAAKRKKLDALLGGIGNGNGKANGGEGNDNKAGDKGKVTGDPNASGYYGSGGGGSGGNYRLGNRKALTKPKPTYDCNEEGKVYVSISVDKSGRVIAAQPGVKGTTNSASCLLRRAREAALKTKFNSDNKAPSKQVGTIIYNFSLN